MINYLHKKIVSLITFPLTSWLYNRKNIKKNFYFFIRTEKKKQNIISNIQHSRIKKVLEYAEKWVPFYKERFKNAGFKAVNFNNFNDLKIIPPLTREDVINHKKELLDVRYQNSSEIADKSKRGPAEPVLFARFKKHKLVRNTSSGSTGYPTVFYENGSITANNWALELRLKKWYGINPGDNEARLVRMATDYMPSDKVIIFRKLLWNQLLLPGVNLGAKDYKIILDKLNIFKPKSLWGFTSSLTGLAEYIIENNLKFNFSPKVIITWAAPLYDHEKTLLEKVFKCPITNIYGMREVGHIASFCFENHLHIHQESHFVENEKTGENTELFVTPLIISPMPFIRYKTGDLGLVQDTTCSCGKNLQEIDQFLGRTGEIYKTKTGQMISPNFWCRTFMDEKRANSIKRFQVIYKRNGDIKILLVKKDSYTDEIEKELKKYLIYHFTNKIKFNFEYLKDIKPQISGKYQMVIKE